MDYKRLGNTGVKVSALCFGTMTFGAQANESASAALYRRCREVGINFFDCADVYANGRSEEILGDLIADERDQIVLTSKFYGGTGEDVNARGGSRLHIRQAVEASLRRLKTDHLDVYFIHHFPAELPLENVLRSLDDLVRDGKILYPAASNFAAWQLAKALGIAAWRGLTRFEVLQPMYNLVKRQAEVEILPLAQAENLGVISYSPLGGGLLSGKYGPQQRPKVGRLVENAMYQARYGQEWIYEVAANFTQFAQERGYEPAALAVAWVASHPAVTAPIIGARSLDQLEGSLKSLAIKMDDALRAEVSALSPTPPPATDRLEEQAQ